MHSGIHTATVVLCLLVGASHADVAADSGACEPGIFDFPQPPEAPDALYALIEIPAGSFTKYEIDPVTGYLLVDRFQSMPVVYPANYGTLPSTLAGDNDPLDVLVYSREPIVPGAFIRVRPIGILKLLDGGEQDDKVIAVPADEVDPYYTETRELLDLPAVERARLSAFFLTYKQLPEGRKQMELQGSGGREMAAKAISDALQQYADTRDCDAMAAQ
jgi:inorganic pyrophosphatase